MVVVYVHTRGYRQMCKIKWRSLAYSVSVDERRACNTTRSFLKRNIDECHVICYSFATTFVHQTAEIAEDS